MISAVDPRTGHEERYHLLGRSLTLIRWNNYFCCVALGWNAAVFACNGPLWCSLTGVTLSLAGLPILIRPWRHALARRWEWIPESE